MTLLVETLRNELDTLNKNNIRLRAIGDVSQLPSRTHKALVEGIENTQNNTRMTLILAPSGKSWRPADAWPKRWPRASWK